jgi:hypothetical protein
MQTEVIVDRVIGPDNLIAKLFRNSNNQTAAPNGEQDKSHDKRPSLVRQFELPVRVIPAFRPQP